VRPAESPDGVDLTLIEWTLSLTPRERLDLLQDWVDGLAESPEWPHRGALSSSGPSGDCNTSVFLISKE
jgi:hypothetical protein